MSSKATPSSTVPKKIFTALGLSFLAMNREPVLLPMSTPIVQSIQIVQFGLAAVAMCDMKLEVPEQVTTIAEVAAAALGSRPAM